MAYIVLSSKKDTETQTFDNKKLLLDADLDRVAYWAANKYFPKGVTIPAVTAADGSITTPASVRAPTGAEIFAAMTDDIYINIKRECEAWYLSEAESMARLSVNPIVLTPAT